ncbi:MAG: response regulator transcription factor [Bradymonadia bacterium]
MCVSEDVSEGASTIDTPPQKKILVVEDDQRAVSVLVSGLSRAGFEVVVAMDGARGGELAVSEHFDLVVLDLMLPEKSGLEVLQAMLGRVSTPVIVLSARTELQTRLKAFDAGAVDYVPKPFFLEELVRRIRARLRLRDEVPRKLIELGSVTLDLDARIATREGHDLKLTGYEFNILAWMAERSGRAISREQLAENALGMEGRRAWRTVDGHVSRIRKKLGPDGERVKTVWGIGYTCSANAE